MQRRTLLLLIGVLIVDLSLVLFGIFSENWFGFPRFKMLSFTVASIGVVTFIGFFTIAYESGPAIERAMRNAIAASVIVMYLVTVGIVTYFPAEITPTLKDISDKPVTQNEPGSTPTVRDISNKPVTQKELGPLTKTMLESFQTVLTVVVGFYFASSAVVEGIQRMKKYGNEQDK